MASISEKTHAKNLENLHIANGIAASAGADFNPNNDAIKADALADFKENFAALMGAVNEALSAEQATVGAQIDAFREVPKRVTKIMKAARGQGLSPEFLENLQSTANRLSGVRVSPKTPDNPATPEDESRANSSSSRRSYAGILESLDLLDEQLKSNPAYKPNETEYKTAAISAWIENLRTVRHAALDAKTDTRAARSARDAHAYAENGGITSRMKAFKAYAETILDAGDPRLKQLKKLKFVDYGK